MKKQNGVSIAEDRVLRERVKQGAEFAKRILSDEPSTTVNIPYLKTIEGQGINLQMPLDRETLNKLTSQLVDKTLALSDAVLAKALVNA